jgi:HAMP domain-containing protein
VLTGDRDDQRGIEAVAAGAQDYLAKGGVDGDGLRRAILYAVERRQADSVRERLRAAEILAEEATRLERGLLPVPILNDGALLVGTGHRPGRERTLLGGDFYDLVHTRDGAVHLMIGDVSGRRRGVPRPLPGGRRERRPRPAPAPDAGPGRDERPPAGGPRGGAPRHRGLAVRPRAPDDRPDPPLRRRADRERRRRGRQGALRRRARVARTPAGRPAGRPRRCPRRSGKRRRVAHAALVFAAGLLGLAVLAIAVLGRQVIAGPIARLARQTRAVAAGDLHRSIEASGPRDIERLGRDVESMRERIVRDLEAVRAAEEEIQEKAVALERSNAELEQFAYVASHDLQEPLRKVTSFCQMIERRYSGQLDERGEQYIAFAVDGAKRMQALINDLLAFSRVGRVVRPPELVDVDELVE